MDSLCGFFFACHDLLGRQKIDIEVRRAINLRHCENRTGLINHAPVLNGLAPDIGHQFVCQFLSIIGQYACLLPPLCISLHLEICSRQQLIRPTLFKGLRGVFSFDPFGRCWWDRCTRLAEVVVELFEDFLRGIISIEMHVYLIEKITSVLVHLMRLNKSQPNTRSTLYQFNNPSPELGFRDKLKKRASA